MALYKGSKVDAKTAGYMELSGAVKDAGCAKVNVTGGVSGSLGCCNLYQPQNKQTQQFKCGVCEYVVSK